MDQSGNCLHWGVGESSLWGEVHVKARNYIVGVRRAVCRGITAFYRIPLSLQLKALQPWYPQRAPVISNAIIVPLSDFLKLCDICFQTLF